MSSFGENPKAAATAELVHDGQVIAHYVTCPCGRGCGNKDVVLCDAFGSHDLEPEIEAVRETEGGENHD